MRAEAWDALRQLRCPLVFDQHLPRAGPRDEDGKLAEQSCPPACQPVSERPVLLLPLGFAGGLLRSNSFLRQLLT